MLNLHAQFTGPDGFAYDRLLISAHDEQGEPLATIGSVMLTDPNLGDRLHQIAQAYRMGTRFGKEER